MARKERGSAPSADPSAYVPRLALESALADLAEGIGKTPSCAVLEGEPGLGKTLLLHVLRERLLGSHECLYVPLPRVSPAELWRWVAVALGLGAGDDDRGAVLGRAASLGADGMGLVLLVDDAGLLPPSTRNDLIGASAASGLSVVMAFASQDHDLLSALPPHVRRVEIGPPMTPAETRAYVQARLRHADPEGSLVARLGRERLATLHAASGGVPARLHTLLEAWLEETESPAAPPATRTAEVERQPPPPKRGLRHPALRIALLALFVLVVAGLWKLALSSGSPGRRVSLPLERQAPADDAARR